MNTKILDIASITLRVPIFSDQFSLRRQFPHTICGNRVALDEAYKLMASWEGQPLAIRMVLIDVSEYGRPAEEVLAASCKAIEVPPSSLAQPSLSQVGSLTSVFGEEVDVTRIVPITPAGPPMGLIWKKASWPSSNTKVFSFEDLSYLRNQVWMMMPLAILYFFE